MDGDIMATPIEYSLMAANAYSKARSIPANVLPIPDGWTLLNVPGTDDSATGFMARVYVRGSEIVIAYTGTTPGWLDWPNGNIPGWLGDGPAAPQIKEAMDLYEAVKDQADPDATISFTGHSLGGGLASLMAIYYNKNATAFDSAPFAASATGLANITDAQTYSSDPEYRSYLASLNLQTGTYAEYDARRQKVTSIATTGEVLSLASAGRIASNAGTKFHDPGATHYSDHPVDLHSQTLLAAMLVSSAFKDVAPKLSILLKDIFDPELFYRDPTDRNQTEPNFLEHVVAREVGDASQSIADGDMLTHFANDLAKFGDFSNDPAREQLFNGLVKLAIQDYYQTKAFTKELFNQGSIEMAGGTEFDLTQSLGDKATALSGILGYADLQAYASQFTPDAAEFIQTARNWFVALGANGMSAESKGESSDFMLGDAGMDRLKGGAGEDFLAGKGGADFLTGGTGGDVPAGSAVLMNGVNTNRIALRAYC
jgi:hypothetical protein